VRIASTTQTCLCSRTYESPRFSSELRAPDSGRDIDGLARVDSVGTSPRKGNMSAIANGQNSKSFFSETAL
jgi:hypothetical protein